MVGNAAGRRLLGQDKETLAMKPLGDTQGTAEARLLKSLLWPLSEKEEHHGDCAPAGEAGALLLAMPPMPAVRLPNKFHQLFPLEGEGGGGMDGRRV